GVPLRVHGGRPYLVRPVALHWDADLTAGERRECGLMRVPVSWWGRPICTPVISFQHGTQVYRECAPSRFNANPLAVLSSPDLTGALQNHVECVVGALMATAGYTVVMPDYQGFGDSTARHPYVNLVLGDSVVGALGAARAVLATRGVTPREGLFLTGYSEGGYATMAGALALRAREVTVTKTIPCDGAYDLSGTMLAQMTSGQAAKGPSYLLYTAWGYHAVNPPLPLYDLLIDECASLVDWGLFDGTHANAQVGYAVPASTIPAHMRDPVTAPGLFAPGGSVHELLDDNNAWEGWGSAPPPVSVHCPLDDVVPFANATVAAGKLGATTKLVGYVPFVAQAMGSIHIAAFPTAMLEAFRIIRE
ncbi:MAG TPA: lipase family protein, partial [Desulfobacterales bacterium]|nr:lipase family protein [Desulfobacterales bacterium]